MSVTRRGSVFGKENMKIGESIHSAKAAPDFSKIHKQWDSKLQKGKAVSKKPLTSVQPFQLSQKHNCSNLSAGNMEFEVDLNARESILNCQGITQKTGRNSIATTQRESSKKSGIPLPLFQRSSLYSKPQLSCNDESRSSKVIKNVIPEKKYDSALKKNPSFKYQSSERSIPSKKPALKEFSVNFQCDSASLENILNGDSIKALPVSSPKLTTGNAGPIKKNHTKGRYAPFKNQPVTSRVSESSVNLMVKQEAARKRFSLYDKEKYRSKSDLMTWLKELAVQSKAKSESNYLKGSDSLITCTVSSTLNSTISTSVSGVERLQNTSASISTGVSGVEHLRNTGTVSNFPVSSTLSTLTTTTNISSNDNLLTSVHETSKKMSSNSLGANSVKLRTPAGSQQYKKVHFNESTHHEVSAPFICHSNSDGSKKSYKTFIFIDDSTSESKPRQNKSILKKNSSLCPINEEECSEINSRGKQTPSSSRKKTPKSDRISYSSKKNLSKGEPRSATKGNRLNKSINFAQSKADRQILAASSKEDTCKSVKYFSPSHQNAEVDEAKPENMVTPLRVTIKVDEPTSAVNFSPVRASAKKGDSKLSNTNTPLHQNSINMEPKSAAKFSPVRASAKKVDPRLTNKSTPLYRNSTGSEAKSAKTFSPLRASAKKGKSKLSNASTPLQQNVNVGEWRSAVKCTPLPSKTKKDAPKSASKTLQSRSISINGGSKSLKNGSAMAERLDIEGTPLRYSAHARNKLRLGLPLPTENCYEGVNKAVVDKQGKIDVYNRSYILQTDIDNTQSLDATVLSGSKNNNLMWNNRIDSPDYSMDGLQDEERIPSKLESRPVAIRLFSDNTETEMSGSPALIDPSSSSLSVSKNGHQSDTLSPMCFSDSMTVQNIMKSMVVPSSSFDSMLLRQSTKSHGNSCSNSPTLHQIKYVIPAEQPLEDSHLSDRIKSDSSDTLSVDNAIDYCKHVPNTSIQSWSDILGNKCLTSGSTEHGVISSQSLIVPSTSLSSNATGASLSITSPDSWTKKRKLKKKKRISILERIYGVETTCDEDVVSTVDHVHPEGNSAEEIEHKLHADLDSAPVFNDLSTYLSPNGSVSHEIPLESNDLFDSISFTPKSGCNSKKGKFVGSTPILRGTHKKRKPQKNMPELGLKYTKDYPKTLVDRNASLTDMSASFISCCHSLLDQSNLTSNISMKDNCKCITTALSKSAANGQEGNIVFKAKDEEKCINGVDAGKRLPRERYHDNTNVEDVSDLIGQFNGFALESPSVSMREKKEVAFEFVDLKNICSPSMRMFPHHDSSTFVTYAQNTKNISFGDINKNSLLKPLQLFSSSTFGKSFDRKQSSSVNDFPTSVATCFGQSVSVAPTVNNSISMKTCNVTESQIGKLSTLLTANSPSHQNLEAKVSISDQDVTTTLFPQLICNSNSSCTSYSQIKPSDLEDTLRSSKLNGYISSLLTLPAGISNSLNSYRTASNIADERVECDDMLNNLPSNNISKLSKEGNHLQNSFIASNKTIDGVDRLDDSDVCVIFSAPFKQQGLSFIQDTTNPGGDPISRGVRVETMCTGSLTSSMISNLPTVGNNGAFRKVYPKSLITSSKQICGESQGLEILVSSLHTPEKHMKAYDVEVSLYNKFAEISKNLYEEIDLIRDGSVNPVSNVLVDGDKMHFVPISDGRYLV